MVVLNEGWVQHMPVETRLGGGAAPDLLRRSCQHICCASSKNRIASWRPAHGRAEKGRKSALADAARTSRRAGRKAERQGGVWPIICLKDREASGGQMHPAGRGDEGGEISGLKLGEQKKTGNPVFLVLPQGLEPWTPTLRVSCSTN